MLSAIASKVSGGSNGQVDMAAAAQGADAHIAGMQQRRRCAQGTAAQLSAAKAYMDARLSGNAAAALQLMSPNVRLTSQRDGAFHGHQQVDGYLRKTSAEGEWSQPHLDARTGLVKFDGRIRYMKMVPISVRGFILFGPDGRIEEIFVGKA
jgi:hypothetical protein